jgi:Tfp pilus assembly protein PilW
VKKRLGYESGFSIVSLMIASAIGMFLIGGSLKVYIDSKNSFNARSAIAAATENLRFSIQDLRRTLIMAGRGIAQSDDDINAYNNTDNGRRTFPGPGVNIDADANGNSVIAIRYADGPTPCGQSGQISGVTTTVSFYVNNNDELVCNDGASAIPLVSNIKRMQALYGVDGTDEDTTADRYVTAGTMTASDWNNVVAIRIGLVSNSGVENPLPKTFEASASLTSNTIKVLGMDYVIPPNDHNLFHKRASTTIALRNRTGTVQRQ